MEKIPDRLQKTIIILLILFGFISSGYIGYYLGGNGGPGYLVDKLCSPCREKKDYVTKSLSSAYIYGPEMNKAKVFLYAKDQTTSTVENIYCGAPQQEAVTYSGHYQLILDSSTAASDNPGGYSDLNWQDSLLDLGSWSFVERTAWDGQLEVEQFDPSGYKNFLVLYGYGSCNTMFATVFGYDFAEGKLVNYKFLKKDGKIEDGVAVSQGQRPLKKSAEGNLLSRLYNQSTGKFNYTEWKFDPKTNTFKELKSWTTSE